MPHIRHVASAIFLLLALPLSGCMRWQVEQTGPAHVLTTDPPGAIRVERRDGSVVELVQAEVRQDTVTGLVPGSAAPGFPLRRVAIPLDEVQRVASRRSDLRRTMGAVLTGPLIFFAGGYLMQW